MEKNLYVHLCQFPFRIADLIGKCGDTLAQELILWHAEHLSVCMRSFTLPDVIMDVSANAKIQRTWMAYVFTSHGLHI